MICIIADVRGDEPSIITGFEFKPLKIIMSDHDDLIIEAPAPLEGWSPDSLQREADKIFAGQEGPAEAAEAYLGDGPMHTWQWIGSTEV